MINHHEKQETQLRTGKPKIDLLEAKLAKTTVQIKSELTTEIEDIRRDIGAVKEKLNEQQNASSTARKPVEAGAEKTSDKLKSVLNQPLTRPIEASLTKTLPLENDQALRRSFIVMDESMSGNFRFGLLLEILDKMAEETSLNYVNRFYPEARVVTAAIDNILVRNPIDVTRDIIFSARINHVGRSEEHTSELQS